MMTMANSKHNDMRPSKNDKESNALFLELFIANQSRIYAYILSKVHNHNDADDLLQETVKTLWTKFDQFELGTDFSAWAVKTAQLNTLKFLRKNRRNRIQFVDSVEAMVDKSLASKMTTLDERADALKHCIQKLSAKDRMLLYMRFEKTQNVKEIANVMKITFQSVYRGLSRIYISLENCIQTQFKNETRIP